MKKFLCFAKNPSFLVSDFLRIASLSLFAALFLSLTGCALLPPMADEDELVSDEAPAVPAAPGSCIKMGTIMNYNDQRILAFQKIVQLQILRIKALPMTEESTQELAVVETLRRRVSYPLLTSSARPEIVTKVLKSEARNFAVFLEKRKLTDTQAQSLLEEVNQHFLPLLENEDHWNCLERQTDFQEETPKPDTDEVKE